MSFMQRQITRKCEWLEVETTAGTCLVDMPNFQWPTNEGLTDEVYDLAVHNIQDYVEGEIQSWQTIKGYGARLSAPGYLDCTEWAVFDSVAKAEKYLEEMYGEEDNEEESAE